MPGCGRKLKDEDFDKQLAIWVRERLAKKQKVSRRMIQVEAQKRFENEDNVEEIEFKVSL